MRHNYLTILWIILGVALFVVSQTQALQLQSTHTTVQIENNRFVEDNVPLFIKGVNYYPQNRPWNEFWPFVLRLNRLDELGKQAEIEIRGDFAKLQAAHFNTIRIFIPFNDITNQPAISNTLTVSDVVVADEHKLALDQLLALAAEHELKVLITLFDQPPVGANGEPYSIYKFVEASQAHLDSLFEPPAGTDVDFRTDGRILAWNLKNEIDRDFAFNDQEIIENWGNALLIHLKDRVEQPVTVSTFAGKGEAFSPSTALIFSDTIDFIAFHYSLPEVDLPQAIATLQQHVPNKPIIIEEFALATTQSHYDDCRTEKDETVCNQQLGIGDCIAKGLSVTDCLHDEEEQAAYINAVLSTIEVYGLAGTMVWTMYDFGDNYPESEHPRHRYEGIFRADGSPKMALKTVNYHWGSTVIFADDFSGWATGNNCEPPLNWRQVNVGDDDQPQFLAEIAACYLRSGRYFDPVHNGHARITKNSPPNDENEPSLADGLIFSSKIEPYFEIQTATLAVSITDYSLYTSEGNTGDINLDIGVKFVGQDGINWLRQDIVSNTVPTFIEEEFSFPTGTDQTFEIVFRLQNNVVDGVPVNGYAAGFELDFIQVECLKCEAQAPNPTPTNTATLIPTATSSPVDTPVPAETAQPTSTLPVVVEGDRLIYLPLIHR